MRLQEKTGYGPNCYIIDHAHWGELVQWLAENEVTWWKVSSGPEGHGFQIKDKFDWFALKWL